MKKYILTVLMMIMTAGAVMAQSSMTDQQIIAFVMEEQEKEVEKQNTEVVKTQPESSSKKDDKNPSENQEVFTYQLGFYSSKENAQNLVNRCKEKNISAQIQQVTRPSGNVYFAVIVKSTNSEIGTIIKNSGFECYPIFE